MNTASMGVMCGGNADDTDAANTQALANANPSSRMIHAREMVSSWAADPSLARPAILAAAPSVEGAGPEASEGVRVVGAARLNTAVRVVHDEFVFEAPAVDALTEELIVALQGMCAVVDGRYEALGYATVPKPMRAACDLLVRLGRAV